MKMEWLGLWLLNINFIYMPETSLKTNKKLLLIPFLFFAVIGGAVLVFQKNSLEAENDKNINSRAVSPQSEARLRQGGSADNKIMLSVANENAKEDGNKAEDEIERELKFRESVKKMFILLSVLPTSQKCRPF